MRSRLIEVYAQDRGGRPDCSVAVPVYNGAPFLRDSIGSVLNQSEATCDILISDDGSDDGSLETILEIVRPYNGPHSVRVFRTEVPAVVEHMPLLVEASRCDHIIQAHQDDMSDPGRAAFLSRMLAGKARLVTSVARVRKGDTVTAPAAATVAALRANSKFKAYLMSGQGIMGGARYGMHRDIFRLFPPLSWDHLSHGQDILLHIRAKMIGACKVVYQPLLTIGDHAARGSYAMFDKQDDATWQFDFSLRRITILSVALKDLAFAKAAGSVPEKRAAKLEKRLVAARLAFLDSLAASREQAIQRGFKLSWVKGTNRWD